MEPRFSRTNPDGIIEASSHLVIIDDASCDQTNAEQLSDPRVLNYYRQFLIEGFDDRFFVGILRMLCLIHRSQ